MLGIVRSNLPPKRPHTFPRRRTRKSNFRHSAPPMTQRQKMMAINARAEAASEKTKPFRAPVPTTEAEKRVHERALERAPELRKNRENAKHERTRKSLQAKLDKQSWLCRRLGVGCAAGGRRRSRRRRRRKRRKRRRTKRRKRRRRRRTRRMSRR